MKKLISVISILIIVTIIVSSIIYNLYLNRRIPSEKKISLFVVENQRTLDLMKDIAFEDTRNLQLEEGRRIWYNSSERFGVDISENEEIYKLYEQMLQTDRICSVFEDLWSDDSGITTTPVIRFENYYKDGKTTYQTIGCVYIESNTPIDVNDYKLKGLKHIVGKWYYFRFMPQT